MHALASFYRRRELFLRGTVINSWLYHTVFFSGVIYHILLILQSCTLYYYINIVTTYCYTGVRVQVTRRAAPYCCRSTSFSRRNVFAKSELRKPERQFRRSGPKGEKDESCYKYSFLVYLRFIKKLQRNPSLRYNINVVHESYNLPLWVLRAKEVLT